MNSYKVTSKVGDDNYTTFVKQAKNEQEAEKITKEYFILEKPELDFYYVIKVEKIN